MRRDSIFYYLFQTYPTLLFELLPNPPANAANYRFDSVAVKEPKFEIDGVFLPIPSTGLCPSYVGLNHDLCLTLLKWRFFESVARKVVKNDYCQWNVNLIIPLTFYLTYFYSGVIFTRFLLI